MRLWRNAALASLVHSSILYRRFDSYIRVKCETTCYLDNMQKAGHSPSLRTVNTVYGTKFPWDIYRRIVEHCSCIADSTARFECTTSGRMAIDLPNRELPALGGLLGAHRGTPFETTTLWIFLSCRC